MEKKMEATAQDLGFSREYRNEKQNGSYRSGFRVGST